MTKRQYKKIRREAIIDVLLFEGLIVFGVIMLIAYFVK